MSITTKGIFPDSCELRINLNWLFRLTIGRRHRRMDDLQVSVGKEIAIPKGYIYRDVEITDLAQYGKYRELAPDIIASFSGRYLIRRGDPRERRSNDTTRETYKCRGGSRMKPNRLRFGGKRTAEEK